MDFFCIPVIFGCQTKIQPEGDQTPRICPRCHNAAVTSAKSKQWFEICFVPLIPMSSKHVWICTICNWSVQVQQGWEPPMVNSNQPGHPAGNYPPAQWQPPQNYAAGQSQVPGQGYQVGPGMHQGR